MAISKVQKQIMHFVQPQQADGVYIQQRVCLELSPIR